MIKFEDYVEIFKDIEEFDSLVQKASELSSLEDNLIVSDFDDTIFSQEEVRNTDIRKGRRGEEGNKYIKEVIGVDKFIQEFYVGKTFPKNIVSKLRKNKDLILTTGLNDIQDAKIKTAGLDNLNYIIVPHSIEKIAELIKYVILELKYLPTQITIYEDRIKEFEKYKNLIEDFLDTKLNLMFVEMNGNNREPEISKLN